MDTCDLSLILAALGLAASLGLGSIAVGLIAAFCLGVQVGRRGSP